MNRSKALIGIVTASFLFLLTNYSIAGPPTAGQLLREQQPRQALPNQLPAQDKKDQEKEKSDGVRIQVTAFTFSGYKGLATEAQLQDVVASAVGKELSFADLKGVAEAVTQYLKDQGWLLARAYLPQQDVSSGVIAIAVVQGKSDGSVKINESSDLRINKERLERMANQGVQAGQAVRAENLERAVLLMNDLPGIKAKASLSPGSAPQTTALTINASEGPLFTGFLWADNYGNRYTGDVQGNGLFQLNDPFKIGDQISLKSAISEGMQTGVLTYSMPLGTSGLSGYTSFTYLEYELGKEFESLDVDGSARTYDVGLKYPCLRTRKTNIYSSIEYEYENLSDAYSGDDYSRKDISSGTLSLYGDHYDAFFGGGITRWNASGTFGDMNEEVADLDITETEGHYTCFNAGLSRLQRLTNRLSMSLAWKAQFSLDNLDSSEQFSLGGPYGVRAYPVSEGIGDEGHLFNLDTHYTLPIPGHLGRLTWNLFYDAGYITLHKNPWINSIDTATGDNHYWLQGAGTGFEYGYKDRFTVRVCWAHTIGSNGGRSINGDDSDGKQSHNRFWLQAMCRF